MKTKIKVKDKVYELSDMCRWEVRDGVLWNLNTNHDEGVDGDLISYDGKTGTVEGYTCYQFVSTKEYGKTVLSAQNYHVHFTHKTPVAYADGTETEKSDGLIHIY